MKLQLPKPDWLLFEDAVRKVAETCSCSEAEAAVALRRAVIEGQIQWQRRLAPLVQLGADLERIGARYLMQDETDVALRDTSKLELSFADIEEWLAAANGPSQPRNAGGRPRKWDWEEALIAVVRLANTPDGLPDKQADLVRFMQRWFHGNAGYEPAESEIRKRTKRIYAGSEPV